MCPGGRRGSRRCVNIPSCWLSTFTSSSDVAAAASFAAASSLFIIISCTCAIRGRKRKVWARPRKHLPERSAPTWTSDMLRSRCMHVKDLKDDGFESSQRKIPEPSHTMHGCSQDGQNTDRIFIRDSCMDALWRRKAREDQRGVAVEDQRGQLGSHCIVPSQSRTRQLPLMPFIISKDQRGQLGSDRTARSSSWTREASSAPIAQLHHD